MHVCEKCGNTMIKYGTIKRVVKGKYGAKQIIKIQKVYCKFCNRYGRILPDDILPYKQYEKEIIEGVQEGLINADVLGFENYPSEKQMIRWKESHKKHPLK